MVVETQKNDIKILLVGPIPPPYGGIPAYVKSLNDAKLGGIEFVLFNTAIPSWVEPFDREGKRNYGSILEIGVLASLKKILYVLYSFVSFIWSLILIRPAIVHVFTCSYWGYWRNWLYLLVAKLFGRKTIFHLLGAIDLFYNEVGDFQRSILRSSLNSADCYLLQSPLLENWAKQYSRKEVIGIWNGIDLTKIPLRSERPPEHIAGMDCPIGLTIGNLSINKGSLEIIDALKLMKDENIKISWVFVGRGDLQQFKKLTEQNGLTENVYFAGEVNELEKWQFLQHASFFCLPSYAEGQPISIIEAMASGLPVISTKIGSIPEMILEGVNGKLINPGDTKALKDAILFLVKNPELGEAMGKASQKLCQERHDIADLYAGLHKIYSRLEDTTLGSKTWE
jgi:glycosyltransferase involved in cell wall biosynthesis